MSQIDELIEKLCPNGVEYKKTKEIKKDSFWLMPATPYYISDGIPYITSKNIKDGKINFENVNYISQEDYINISANRKIEKDDLLVTMIGTIGETAFVEDHTEFYGQNMYLIRLDDTKINRKFFNYYLTSPKVKNLLVTKRNISNQGYIKAGNLEELSIPVPPLEIQNEIVNILDKFTALLAELKAELKARKKQYAYYRDKLFEFDDDIKVPLSAICEIKRGGTFQKKDFINNGIPAIHYGKIYTYYGLYTDKTLNFINEDVAKKQKFAKPNDIIMAVTSENVEDVCKCVVWEGNELVAVSGHSIIISHNQNARYLAYYFTSSHFQSQKEKCCFGTKVIEIKLEHFSKILVPIPNIEEQNRIVEILNKFYTITNSLTEGIPAEIEARQKQYEYYRDKLLTFKELVMDE